MAQQNQFIAFDLGATSGRTIVGTLDNEGHLSVEEITRFPNQMLSVGTHLYWNVYSLLKI